MHTLSTIQGWKPSNGAGCGGYVKIERTPDKRGGAYDMRIRGGGLSLAPLCTHRMQTGRTWAGWNGGVSIGWRGWAVDGGGNAENLKRPPIAARGGGRQMRFALRCAACACIHNPLPPMFSLLLWILYYQLPLGACCRIRFDRQGPPRPLTQRTA